MPEQIDIPAAPRGGTQPDPEHAQPPLAAAPAGDEAPAPPPAATASSPLADRLRALHAPVVARATEEFPVPGWVDDHGRPTLKARVGVVADPDEFVAAADAENGNATLIAQATRCLLMLNADGRFEELVVDGAPVRFDHVFARLMGWQVKNATGVVEHAVGPHDPGQTNPLAIGTFADEILEWMRGKRNDAASALRPT